MPWHQINGYTPTTRNQVCSICGTRQRTDHRESPEPVYTTGVFIEYEGTFDICHGCLIEGAVLAGCLTDVQADALRESASAAEATAATAEADLRDAQELIEGFRKVLASRALENLPVPVAEKPAKPASGASK